MSNFMVTKSPGIASRLARSEYCPHLGGDDLGTVVDELPAFHRRRATPPKRTVWITQDLNSQPTPSTPGLTRGNRVFPTSPHTYYCYYDISIQPEHKDWSTP